MSVHTQSRFLAFLHDFRKAEARRLVQSVLDAIVEAARSGEEVALSGFGRFRVTNRAARQGRNPQTGEAVRIAAKKALKFQAAKAMKEGLNTKTRNRKKAA